MGLHFPENGWKGYINPIGSHVVYDQITKVNRCIKEPIPIGIAYSRKMRERGYRPQWGLMLGTIE